MADPMATPDQEIITVMIDSRAQLLIVFRYIYRYLCIPSSNVMTHLLYFIV